MKAFKWIGIVCVLCLFLPTHRIAGEAAKPPEVQKRLGGATRYLAHVSTDKPIYRPGENLYVRAIVVDALTRAPLMTPAMGMIEVVSPKGDTVARGMANLENGALGYKWPIEDSVAGGDYTVKVSFPHHGYPPAERGFNIRVYRQRRLRTQIEFGREGYAPGDEVTATLEVSRSEGGIPAGAKADVVARVDRREVWRGTATVGADGFATARFTLPDTIAFGDGTLSFAIEDGGVVETAAKTIPILIATVDLKAYPEGGDLIAGLENRVYFEAIAPNGRPADIVAALVDGTGTTLLTAKSEHEGRGRFRFTPKEDTTYTLKVMEPWIVTTEFTLPQARKGVTLRATRERYGAGEPIELEIGWGEKIPQVRVVVSHREAVVGEALALPIVEKYWQAWTSVRLNVPPEVSGVLRATVFDDKDVPRAERLIYREPAEKVHVVVEPDRSGYIPGGKVALKVRTTNASGAPVAGFIGLTVTDDATLEMVETREQAPRLPVQVYLEPEVRELADAHVYLSDEPQAPRALDLLLGTQGWRRFAFIDVDAFLKTHGDAARRVLAEMRPVIYRDVRFGAVPGAVAVNGLAMPGDDDRVDREDLLGEKRVEGKADGEMARKKPDAGKEGEDRQRARAGIEARRRPMAVVPLVAEEPAIFADLERLPPSIFPVRVYAHTVRPNRQPNDRVDFTETLYWNAAVATDENGEATVTFDLSDSVSSFRAMADAYTKTGAFGAGNAVIESRRPFYVEAKTPLEVTAGDQIQLPVVLINETDKTMTAEVAVSTSGSVAIGPYPGKVQVPARTRKRVIVPAAVQNRAGLTEVFVTARTADFTDQLTRTITARPLGFPIALNFGGLLEGEAAHKITIPESLTDGGVTAQAAVYPTPLANLTKALEALIRDPNGCFEQTSSTNYPLVMAMQYFQTHQGVDPDLVRRSREKLAKGYKRLVGYECKQKGYEWFGGDPGHEALTAYGLLEFNDMAEVHPVDPKMMERTRHWLLARRDGQGGFERNARALDSFGRAPEAITNGYITWALAASGEKDIEKELAALRDAAAQSDDPYLIALAAGSLVESGRAKDAAPMLKRLASMQDADGSVKGAKTSITRSGGQSLLIETTALSIMAWLSDGAYAGNVEKAMKWLCEACEGGRFGSTQSTVLALKAIVDYDQSRARPEADGTLVLSVDGRVVETRDFTKDTQAAIEFGDFAGSLSPGEHVVSLQMKDGSPMPYSIAIEYHAEKPSDAKACPLEMTSEITDNQVEEGAPVDIIIRARNTRDEGLPMTMVIAGLPGGLEPRHEQLKESVKAGKFSFYEIRGRDVAIYFRDLPPKAEREIVLSAIAAAPGTYVGPASRAYLYYTPEEKKWTEGLRVTVTAK